LHRGAKSRILCKLGVRAQKENMATKKDILEQLVEEYLTHKGYFGGGGGGKSLSLNLWGFGIYGKNLGGSIKE